MESSRLLISSEKFQSTSSLIRERNEYKSQYCLILVKFQSTSSSIRERNRLGIIFLDTLPRFNPLPL
ncbi:hypothetical protein LEP1GSC008_1546 [Leptospira kirschneri serovar Bulgarica str. Nikolaevo]|uniref:Uncharacterized protein n=1 Tax=Leptospira kirschneri serovar Bulgarica str. Nikolaevo TaxID=1240687 RepID=M6FA06_9LEPT|nr:hypothetical protein LEP1GSC008_1546 [Leptospira kirschneri serovar Bulgarica str. Nikolaevo]